MTGLDVPDVVDPASHHANLARDKRQRKSRLPVCPTMNYKEVASTCREYSNRAGGIGRWLLRSHRDMSKPKITATNTPSKAKPTRFQRWNVASCTSARCVQQ